MPARADLGGHQLRFALGVVRDVRLGQLDIGFLGVLVLLGIDLELAQKLQASGDLPAIGVLGLEVAEPLDAGLDRRPFVQGLPCGQERQLVFQVAFGVFLLHLGISVRVFLERLCQVRLAFRLFLGVGVVIVALADHGGPIDIDAHIHGTDVVDDIDDILRRDRFLDAGNFNRA